MKVFLVTKYSRGNDEFAELADALVTVTQAAGHTPFIVDHSLGLRRRDNEHEACKLYQY